MKYTITWVPDLILRMGVTSYRFDGERWFVNGKLFQGVYS